MHSEMSLGKHLLVKTTAVVGPTVEMGDVQEATHLNRLLRLYPIGAEVGERWELEAYTLDTWKSWCHRWVCVTKTKL